MDAKKSFNLLVILRCFNPRARDGREIVKADLAILSSVSIHAPVMDANIFSSC